MCEHVVKVENVTRINIEGSGNSESRKKMDRRETSTVHEIKSAAPTRSERTGSASPRRTNASNRIDEPSECRVQLFERNELQVEYVVGSVYIHLPVPPVSVREGGHGSVWLMIVLMNMQTTGPECAWHFGVDGYASDIWQAQRKFVHFAAFTVTLSCFLAAGKSEDDSKERPYPRQVQDNKGSE